jgi:hypothetical protein
MIKTYLLSWKRTLGKLKQINSVQLEGAKVAELAKDADALMTRNGETIAYIVNPEHY